MWCGGGVRRDAIIDRLRGGDVGVLCSLDRALLSVQAGVAVPCEFVRYRRRYRRGCEQEAELLTRCDQVVVRGPAGEDPSVRAWWDGDGLLAVVVTHLRSQPRALVPPASSFASTAPLRCCTACNPRPMPMSCISTLWGDKHHPRQSFRQHPAMCLCHSGV